MLGMLQPTQEEPRGRLANATSPTVYACDHCGQPLATRDEVWCDMCAPHEIHHTLKGALMALLASRV